MERPNFTERVKIPFFLDPHLRRFGKQKSISLKRDSHAHENLRIKHVVNYSQ